MSERLLEGFKDFHRRSYEESKLMPVLAEEGQDPDYFIISCIDSRSNPGTIFSAPPGTFFAHKAMGAIVRPYKPGTALAAALQFAINYNNVSKVILLGHTGCGAIKALIDEIDDEEISSFIEVARSGLTRAEAIANNTDKDLQRLAEEQILLQSADNIMSYPSVKKAVDAGRVEVLTWLFDMHEGTIYGFDKDRGTFRDIMNRGPSPSKR